MSWVRVAALASHEMGACCFDDPQKIRSREALPAPAQRQPAPRAPSPYRRPNSPGEDFAAVLPLSEPTSDAAG